MQRRAAVTNRPTAQLNPLKAKKKFPLPQLRNTVGLVSYTRIFGRKISKGSSLFGWRVIFWEAFYLGDSHLMCTYTCTPEAFLGNPPPQTEVPGSVNAMARRKASPIKCLKNERPIKSPNNGQNQKLNLHTSFYAISPLSFSPISSFLSLCFLFYLYFPFLSSPVLPYTLCPDTLTLPASRR